MGPTRDISPTLINYLGGAYENGWRDREVKRFGGPRVDDEIDARGSLER